MNPQSLGVIDDMFYRLPFPDSGRMDKLHAAAQVTPDAVTFLNEMQSDFNRPNAMSDLRSGWEAYLHREMNVPVDAGYDGGASGAGNPARRSLSIRQLRSKTPTQSEDEAEVCSLH